jgi:hypothetical protein
MGIARRKVAIMTTGPVAGMKTMHNAGHLAASLQLLSRAVDFSKSSGSRTQLDRDEVQLRLQKSPERSGEAQKFHGVICEATVVRSCALRKGSALGIGKETALPPFGETGR